MKKMKTITKLCALMLFMASFNGLKAQTWDFTSGVENWNWGVVKCTATQSNGNLVVNSAGTGNAEFGITGADFMATNLNYLVVNVKNQTAAPYIAINLWVSIPDGNGGYLAETIKGFQLAVAANTSTYQRRIANLASMISGYSQTWRINRIRFTAVSQSVAGVISIDYVRFVSDAHVEWNFDSEIEGWGGFNNLQCATSQADGNLVVAQTAFASANLNLGVGNINFIATNDNYLVLKLKNQSPATSLSVILWAQALTGSTYGSAFTRTVILPITANSSEFKEYRINLTSYTGFANTWQISNLRIDAGLVNTDNRMYFDFIGFKKFITPDAPTSVAATAGDNQALVSFTAPTNVGGSPILNYTVTSNPGGFTTTGATSPLTVTGLTNLTAYTFTVTANNAEGTGVVSAASASVTPSTTTGISPALESSENAFQLYPTLVNKGNALSLNMTDLSSKVLEVSVINLQGRMLQKVDMLGQRNIQIPTSNLNSGTYFISIKTEGNQIFKKFIVK
jgi:hypothetical protein